MGGEEGSTGAQNEERRRGEEERRQGEVRRREGCERRRARGGPEMRN